MWVGACKRIMHELQIFLVSLLSKQSFLNPGNLTARVLHGVIAMQVGREKGMKFLPCFSVIRALLTEEAEGSYFTHSICTPMMTCGLSLFSWDLSLLPWVYAPKSETIQLIYFMLLVCTVLKCWYYDVETECSPSMGEVIQIGSVMPPLAPDRAMQSFASLYWIGPRLPLQNE